MLPPTAGVGVLPPGVRPGVVPPPGMNSFNTLTSPFLYLRRAHRAQDAGPPHADQVQTHSCVERAVKSLKGRTHQLESAVPFQRLSGLQRGRLRCGRVHVTAGPADRDGLPQQLHLRAADTNTYEHETDTTVLLPLMSSAADDWGLPRSMTSSHASLPEHSRSHRQGLQWRPLGRTGPDSQWKCYTDDFADLGCVCTRRGLH